LPSAAALGSGAAAPATGVVLASGVFEQPAKVSEIAVKTRKTLPNLRMPLFRKHAQVQSRVNPDT
jgi:hypothetical protein